MNTNELATKLRYADKDTVFQLRINGEARDALNEFVRHESKYPNLSAFIRESLLLRLKKASVF
jgi:hypothetical protein